MKYFYLLLWVVLSGICSNVQAQQVSLSKLKSRLDVQEKLQKTGLKMTVINKTQAGILFSTDNNLRTDQSIQWLYSQLNLRKGVDLLMAESKEINTGDVTVNQLHQYYKGIKVEHGIIKTTNKNGRVAMMQLEYYPIADNFKTAPSITEADALKKAIDFTGAYKYAWTDYTGNDPNYMLPHGELVIVKTYADDSSVCLAYKFDINALYPFSRQYVYVNAWDGTVVLNDATIKHADRNKAPLPRTTDTAAVVDGKIILAGKSYCFPEVNISSSLTNDNNINNYSNSPGTAVTRYLGVKDILTDNGNTSGNIFNPYRLRQTRNGQNIVTLNYNNNPHNTTTDFESLASDFTDNDNNWTASEFELSNDNAALDVQYNMQIVSDYWLNVHNRTGWDNNGGKILSYVHVTENKYTSNGTFISQNYMPNAFWNKGSIHFGDGTGNFDESNPYTTLDICGHEYGHAITETTSSLVYQWESGAINESFSDIWAACITNYAKLHYGSMPGELTWRVAEKCENLKLPHAGFRDMANPALFFHPSTYKNLFWKPASLTTCNDFKTTDNCGVHTNSGVLNKWFYLITEGESSINSFGYSYTITGLGFGISQKIAYLTSINLPPNATYQTLRTVSTNAAEILYGTGSAELQTVKDAWLAVAVDSNIYNMTNTPIFTTNNFTTIAVGANGDVWAGTNYNGLYRYNGTAWEKRIEIPNLRINDIKADKAGDIWIAQSGTQANASQALAGGVNYIKAPFAADGSNNTLYTIGASSNIPSRNARCIFIDTSRTNDGPNTKAWVACNSYLPTANGTTTSGMLGQGLYSTTKFFRNISEGINIASGSASVNTVGGNSSEIWAYAPLNNGINQLLSYNAGTNALIKYYDHNTDAIIPSGFSARAIYGDAKKRIWIGLANNGLLVFDEHRNWHYVNLPTTIYPAGTQVNFNAITGDKWGDIYIGTNNGLLFFDRGDGLTNKIDNPANYRMFTKNNGLPSNVVNGIAYDSLRFKLAVATDNGVVFYEPLCLAPFCRIYKTKAEETTEAVASGNWSNPAIWSTNKVPDSLTVVFLNDTVTVDIDAKCRSLTVIGPGKITVNTGKKLQLYEPEDPVILGIESGVKSIGGTLPVSTTNDAENLRTGNFRNSLQRR